MLLMENRVAKCHGYGGYIRVKIFACWGKKFGRTCNSAKSSLFWKDLNNLCKLSVYKLANFVIQYYYFVRFFGFSAKIIAIRVFARVKLHLKVLLRIDILEL